MKRSALPSIAGLAIAWLGFLGYFLVVPRWPALRDAGWPNVALSAAGACIALIAVGRLWSGKRRKTAAALAFGAIFPPALLSVYIFILSYQLPSAEGVIEVGARAPDFSLRDQDGRPRTLAEFDGKKRLLVFFRGHW